MKWKTLLLIISLTVLFTPGLFAIKSVPVIPLENTPSWISGDQYNYTTGAALADMDNDGWLDFIVSNGNDMSRQKVAIYYNNGDGTFPTMPNWTSLEVEYHGHLSVGDIDKDGWNDLAVSVFLGPGGFSEEGWVKVYMNDGTGELERIPSWISSDTFFSFRCSLGDADGDGDLDLAVATGESYYHGPNPTPNRIYYNVDGELESTPGWLSDDLDHSFDAAWGDVDNDGDLDLAFTNSGDPNRLYVNEGGIIETTASWSSTDGSQDGNTLTWGDVDGDGWLDLAVADNYQLGGTGHFKVYFNDGTGTLQSNPGWQSNTSGYGSAVSFMDVDRDGDSDLAAGRWWSQARIYENTGNTLTTTPAWVSTTNSVIEAMVWGDVDRDGLRVTVNEAHIADGVKKVFYLQHPPVHSIMWVRVGNSFIPSSAYCYDPAAGWISLSFAPESGEKVKVTYKHTTSPDLGVSNWDPDEGNFLFYHDEVSPAAMGHKIAIPGP
ncbi:MAG: FG-GAP repeat domain-containing protein [Candidatus Glassbacteria bacterium]